MFFIKSFLFIKKSVIMQKFIYFVWQLYLYISLDFRKLHPSKLALEKQNSKPFNLKIVHIYSQT